MELTTKFQFLIVYVVILGLLSACSTTQTTTQTRRTAIEQLLLSQAVTRSFSERVKTVYQLPLPFGSKVALDTTGISKDINIVDEIIGGWLGRQGYVLVKSENAEYGVTIIVNSLGTEYGETFFGIPPTKGSLIPIAFPELSIYKSQNQMGYINFHFNIIELPSGRFIQTTPSYFAETFYNDYTIMFLFGFNKTDLTNPPDFRSLERAITY